MSQAEILYRFIQQIVQQDIPEVKHVNLFHAQNTNPAQTLRYPVPAVLLQLQPTTANKLEELFYNELMPFSIHLVMNNIAETSTDSEVESLSLLQKVKKQLLISQLPDYFVDLRYLSSNYFTQDNEMLTHILRFQVSYSGILCET